MANCGSVEAIAEYILGDLLQQQGKKTLFIVDEHGALFPDSVPSATSRLPVLRSLGCFNTWTSGVNSGACVVFTSTAKFERSVLRNSDYVVDVGPLSQDTFEKLFKIAIARFTLTTQRTLDSRKDAVIKVTNRVPGDLTSLDQLIQGRHLIVEQIDRGLEAYDKEHYDLYSKNAGDYFNKLEGLVKVQTIEALIKVLLPGLQSPQPGIFEWEFLDLGLVYRWSAQGMAPEYRPINQAARRAIVDLYKTH
ncbi:hypothetical protein BX616_008480, partial [Lobosporangium transversale]